MSENRKTVYEIACDLSEGSHDFPDNRLARAYLELFRAAKYVLQVSSQSNLITLSKAVEFGFSLGGVDD